MHVQKLRQSEKVGCMVLINVSLNAEDGYTLTRFNSERTHHCILTKARHYRCFKKVDTCVAKRIEINDEIGIKMFKTSSL